jgi:Fe2+ or Zn2+ uptake regulation protein
MERDGIIRRIDLGDGKAYYESGADHHEHVRCETCGRVAEVPGCVLEDATSGVQSSTGFVVTSHHLVFSGLCPNCSRTTARD